MLEPGTLVDVRYPLRDPGVNELRGAARAGAGGQALLTGVILTMVGLGLLV